MGDVIFLVVAGLKLYGIFVLISIVILFFAGVASSSSSEKKDPTRGNFKW